jgi:glucan phosphorylase
MKAALKGVPSLSVLDGWWIESCIEGAMGWSIRTRSDSTGPAEDADALYERLEKVVLPTFYERRDKFTDMMHHAIAVNGSFFNSNEAAFNSLASEAFRQRFMPVIRIDDAPRRCRYQENHKRVSPPISRPQS